MMLTLFISLLMALGLVDSYDAFNTLAPERQNELIEIVIYDAPPG